MPQQAKAATEIATAARSAFLNASVWTFLPYLYQPGGERTLPMLVVDRGHISRIPLSLFEESLCTQARETSSLLSGTEKQPGPTHRSADSVSPYRERLEYVSPGLVTASASKIVKIPRHHPNGQAPRANHLPLSAIRVARAAAC